MTVLAIRAGRLAVAPARGEGVSPLRVAGILPATQKNKGRMPSPRERKNSHAPSVGEPVDDADDIW